MTRLFLITFIALTLAACSTNSSHDISNADTTKATTSTQTKTETKTQILADTAKVKSLSGDFRNEE
jgi:PBP1b-binding outer membrane lipoprotein LpoB